jgi:hypothetical protein
MTLKFVKGAALLLPLISVLPNIKTENGAAWKLPRTLFSKEYICAWTILAAQYDEDNSFFYIEVLELKGKKDKKIKNASHEFRLKLIASDQPLYWNSIPVSDRDLFTSQFFVNSNRVAYDLTLKTLGEICLGELNPISEEKDQLILRFGSLNVDEEGSSFIIPDREIH